MTRLTGDVDLGIHLIVSLPVPHQPGGSMTVYTFHPGLAEVDIRWQVQEETVSRQPPAAQAGPFIGCPVTV